MNTQNPTVRHFLILSVALPTFAIAEESATTVVAQASSIVESAPSWNGQRLLIAGTGMRGRSRSSSSVFSFKKRAAKEDGSKFIDPDFQDVVGPAGRGADGAIPSAVATTPDRTKSVQPTAKPTAVKQPAVPSQAKRQPQKATSARSAKTASKGPAKPKGPSVEDLLREMYERDGREMPEMSYQPVAADNPAVRAARVKRGLPAVPSNEPIIETVPLSDLEISLDGSDNGKQSTGEDATFFPADVKPASPKPTPANSNTIVFFPDDKKPAANSSALEEAPEAQAEAKVPTRNVAQIFEIEPVDTPVANTPTRQSAAQGMQELEIPNVEIQMPVLPVVKSAPAMSSPSSGGPQIELPPAIDLPDLSKPASPVADQPKVVKSQPSALGWRAASRSKSRVKTAAQAEGWKSPRGNLGIETSDVASNTAVESGNAIANDPIANAFVEDEGLVATNESLDIAPRAFDVSSEQDDSAGAINHRENLTGLKGFCPVTLCEHRDLVDANPQFSAVYQDRTYYVSSYEALAQFRENPEKYAPVLGGLDVVSSERDGNQVDGILDHAAWYRGKLYLFESAQTLAAFSADPKKYAVH